MEILNRTTVDTNALPVKIVQFGEGNFLRAFVDWFVDVMNEKAGLGSGIAVVQPIEHGMTHLLQEQDGLYHHLMQGIEDGSTIDEVRLITSIQQAINPFKDSEAYYHLATSEEVKLIFSNTTEAGIVFDKVDKPEDGKFSTTFPGKLTQFLRKRYEQLGDTEISEIGIIPCELVEANGDKLKKCIGQYIELWQLSPDFKSWVNRRVHFANTLVDRIVPGYPREEIEEIQERIGFNDQLVVKSESFHLFVIEGDAFIQKHFPAHKHGFNVKYVKSIVPYRTQKVRILNGAHTSMVPVGLLSDLETVSEAISDDQVGAYVRQTIFEEIVATIDLPGEDPKVFAQQVLNRFENPFIRHELISISLNSISKWKVRVLPTILDYYSNKGTLPKHLVFSLACLIQLHMSERFDLKDNEAVLDFFSELKSKNLRADELISAVITNQNFWGQNLKELSGFTELVTSFYSAITSSSVRETLTTLSHEKSLANPSK